MRKTNSKIKYLSESAPAELFVWLTSQGYDVKFTTEVSSIDTSVSSHADIQMCRLGCRDDSPIIRAADEELAAMSGIYPNDISFNAACTGKVLLHNLKYTNARLLGEARKAGMALVDVPQGYAKCSVVVVDENSIITYDKGIAEACRQYNEKFCVDDELISVLLIESGHIKLPGYSTGFIGGTSGRVGDTIVFCGDITAHPDGPSIIDFIRKRGLDVKYFEFPLIDVGSII